jgi:hypothetical protein
MLVGAGYSERHCNLQRKISHAPESAQKAWQLVRSMKQRCFNLVIVHIGEEACRPHSLYDADSFGHIIGACPEEPALTLARLKSLTM